MFMIVCWVTGLGWFLIPLLTDPGCIIQPWLSSAELFLNVIIMRVRRAAVTEIVAIRNGLFS